jgi:hypothetical protein
LALGFGRGEIGDEEGGDLGVLVRRFCWLESEILTLTFRCFFLEGKRDWRRRIAGRRRAAAAAG